MYGLGEREIASLNLLLRAAGCYPSLLFPSPYSEAGCFLPASRLSSFLSSLSGEGRYSERFVLLPAYAGHSVVAADLGSATLGVPAGAEVFLAVDPARLETRCCPRSRGGDPSEICCKVTPGELSPLVRRYSVVAADLGSATLAVPARAEVSRLWTLLSCLHWSCPRSRGGVPQTATLRAALSALSPFPRRCPEYSVQRTGNSTGVPAPAAVSPPPQPARLAAVCCPRSGGGVPRLPMSERSGAWLSPFARRCSVSFPEDGGGVRDVPARVEVFPLPYPAANEIPRCPRSRRGVPEAKTAHRAGR